MLYIHMYAEKCMSKAMSYSHMYAEKCMSKAMLYSNMYAEKMYVKVSVTHPHVCRKNAGQKQCHTATCTPKLV